MTKPLFLISNDDGVHAPGIRALAAAVEPFADWVIVAPQVEKSGSGMCVSLNVPLRKEKLASNIYAVEGTPVDCVMFALNKVFDRQPTMVLSGINRGSNIGQDCLYSGTIAAAMEGCLRGIPAVAFSLNARRAFEESDYADAVKVVRLILEQPALFNLAQDTVLNVNIPSGPVNKMRGFAVCPLGRRIYDSQISENVDPRGRPYYWIGGGGDDIEHIPGSDCNMLQEHFITLTALTPDRVHQRANTHLANDLLGVLNENLQIKA